MLTSSNINSPIKPMQVGGEIPRHTITTPTNRVVVWFLQFLSSSNSQYNRITARCLRVGCPKWALKEPHLKLEKMPKKARLQTSIVFNSSISKSWRKERMLEVPLWRSSIVFIQDMSLKLLKIWTSISAGNWSTQQWKEMETPCHLISRESLERKRKWLIPTTICFHSS